MSSASTAKVDAIYEAIYEVSTAILVAGDRECAAISNFSQVGKEREINSDNDKVGIFPAVSPLTKTAASALNVSQPSFDNSIYEGVGARDSNSNCATHHQYGVEPAAHDYHSRRYLSQEQRSSVIQALLQIFVG